MSTERNVGIGDVVEDTARYVRDAAGWAGHRIPPTERLEEELDELLEHVVHTVRLPRSPEVVKVLDPWDMRHRARRGAEWVEDQLEPLRDRLDPVRDHIEALRRKPIPRSGVGEVEDEDDGWGLVEWVLFGLFLEWLSEQELTLSIDVDRALWSFDDDEDGRFEVWNETVFTPTISHAARLGDPVMHGDPVAPGAGSPDVLVGGKPALRACDGHVCTKATPVPHVGAGFRSTYCGVEINGFPALRVGDFVDEGPHGLNPIVAGCPTVSIGPVAPPMHWVASA